MFTRPIDMELRFLYPFAARRIAISKHTGTVMER